ncbi:MAG: hypothetical protein K0S96_1735 [Geminicoccaceae bacterium]|nr:hypothetical protein [Geminicoccaceae bacterium]
MLPREGHQLREGPPDRARPLPTGQQLGLAVQFHDGQARREQDRGRTLELEQSAQSWIALGRDPSHLAATDQPGRRQNPRQRETATGSAQADLVALLPELGRMDEGEAHRRPAGHETLDLALPDRGVLGAAHLLQRATDPGAQAAGELVGPAPAPRACVAR